MKKNNLTREQAEEIYNALKNRVNNIIAQSASQSTADLDMKTSSDQQSTNHQTSLPNGSSSSILLIVGVLLFSAGLSGMVYMNREEVSKTVQRASLGLVSESKFFSNKNVDNLEEVAIQLEAKRINLEQKERELKARAEELKFIDSAIQQKIEDLRSYLKRLERAKSEKSFEEKTKLEMLVNLVMSMPAKEAANLLQGLDNDVIVEILGAMPERRSASILGFFNRERAVRIARLMSDMSKTK